MRVPLCVEKDLEVKKKVLPLHSRLRNGGLKVLQKTVASAPSGASREKKSKIFPETLAGLKKMRTFAAPFEKRVLERGIGKFIEKTDYCTRSKYREKYNLSRSVNSFERIRSVSDKLEIYKKLYNEEFDPGSG